jgi:hypothetical protein
MFCSRSSNFRGPLCEALPFPAGVISKTFLLTSSLFCWGHVLAASRIVSSVAGGERLTTASRLNASPAFNWGSLG